jgi:hypothetical protein
MTNEQWQLNHQNVEATPSLSPPGSPPSSKQPAFTPCESKPWMNKSPRKTNLLITASLLCALSSPLEFALPVLAQGKSIRTHRAPILGADQTYADSPHPLITAWGEKDQGDEMAAAWTNAGLKSLRFSFAGIYSPRGVEATARVKQENKTTNQFPWFPFTQYVDFIAAHNFTTVVAINVEEGPAVAAEVVRSFVERGAKRKLVAIELSNEPHLNHRPWLPEEYAARAADVIERVTPMGVRFALPLTVGKDRNTPTRLSDDEWNSRMMRALSARVDLKSRIDIYGVLHLYSGGVRARSIEFFNKAIRPFAPRMRYLVTEFNIRHGLEGNPHLTNEYAREFARKLAELMAEPDIEAMYVHSVPYHSILYWSNGRRIATVVGQRDSRLTGPGMSRGWHQTPAGKVYRLYSNLAWNGDVIAYGGSDKQRYWAVRDKAGRVVVTLLNDDDKETRKSIKVEGRELVLRAPPRSIECFTDDGTKLEGLSLK